jgi:hypothetical protein
MSTFKHVSIVFIKLKAHLTSQATSKWSIWTLKTEQKLLEWLSISLCLIFANNHQTIKYDVYALKTSIQSSKACH